MMFDSFESCESCFESTPWSEVYPPDFDHGGTPLLGDNPKIWADLLSEVVFLNANCTHDGRVLIVVATVEEGFVEVRGQLLAQGQPLDPQIAKTIESGRFRIPVSKDASAVLGLEIELQANRLVIDWQTEARRMELDLLSTISRIATSTAPSIARHVR